jgi:hypothetical protein
VILKQIALAVVVVIATIGAKRPARASAPTLNSPLRKRWNEDRQMGDA